LTIFHGLLRFHRRWALPPGFAHACPPIDKGAGISGVLERRTNQDFAHRMRELVDRDYPRAPVVRVVMDNLSTHSAGAIYDTFPAHEARRVLKRLEFHYTPRHASWLNMVEIEIGVLRSQCLDRRIEDKKTLIAEIAAWQRRRNREKARIKWMFTTEKAREKLGNAYPVKES
jgi:DDE superfamily endonuclease